ncbi:carbohydrate kinase family protein [Thalassospira xiamenensis]|uniref:Pseudouridine kinase n=1 Tax=Thalassospira xiamenensis TaxID=220697 RepID=A0A285RD11_9PROT|nr:carbohydrate kinase family protein [Thalassospira xiamenensis]SOB91784.1 pseudouridine kinase [Thalassospira xiamenensis]
MINPASNILCLGAAHFDRTLQCTETFVPAASNPVRTLHRKPGGVSRNIAVHLRLLGCNVGMLGAVGDDGDGDQIIRSLSEIGIDTRQIRKIPGGHTAGYTAILDETGELALGLMDAEVYDRLTYDLLADQLANIQNWPWWLVDANLPTETLTWLANQKGTSRFCAATVSPSKSARFKPLLDKLDVLIANRAEANVLSGIEINDIDDAVNAIKSLRDHGIPHIVVTLGAKGVISADDREIAFWRPLPTKVVDVNGAGDAFYSGFLSAFSKPETSFDAAIGTGLAMASLTAETHGTTVWNLDSKTVQERALNAYKETI